MNLPPQAETAIEVIARPTAAPNVPTACRMAGRAGLCRDALPSVTVSRRTLRSQGGVIGLEKESSVSKKSIRSRSGVTVLDDGLPSRGCRHDAGSRGASPRQRAEHALDADGESEDGLRDRVIDDAESGGEIDGANHLV